MRSQPKLMPLGGVEDNSGYKGFGLGYVVEMISSESFIVRTYFPIQIIIEYLPF